MSGRADLIAAGAESSSRDPTDILPGVARATSSPPPILVIYGEEEHLKRNALRQALDRLLPPEVDRGMALCEYDGGRPEDQGGPTLAGVMDDLRTLPFLADRRVVLIQEADRFVSQVRERLERYLESPSPSATLILLCRSFPKTTRLHKAAAACGEVTECKRLTGRALQDFASAELQRLGARAEPGAVARLLELVGSDSGVLASELEKLSLYALDAKAIRVQDVDELVGMSREERIFAVLDAAGAGQLPRALQLWDQVLASDPAAAFKAVGGLAFVARRWLLAQQLRSEGQNARAIAPRVMMWGREDELDAILRRQTPGRMRGVLAAIADLDAQAKSGARSIENGVEALLVALATPAA